MKNEENGSHPLIQPEDSVTSVRRLCGKETQLTLPARTRGPGERAPHGSRHICGISQLFTLGPCHREH